MEIDNHSGMMLLGSNCLSVHYFERLVDVYVLVNIISDEKVVL